MKTMTLKERLRHHVTGAIERGEAEAIAAIPLPTIGEKLQSIKHDKQATAEFIAKSNPSLVCAAPDLLEALRFILADYIAIQGDKLTGSSIPIEKAKAAIAKAEGNL